MYHISEDMRAQASALRICDALLACAQHRPFSEITVTGLSREYGISRTTFYRLFDNTVDVLEYACEQMGRSILLHVQGDTPREMTINAMKALLERRELIRLLCESGHADIFQRVQERYLPLSRLVQRGTLGESSAYFHRLVAMLIPAAFDVWVREGQRDTPEVVYEKLRDSLRLLDEWFVQ